MNYVLIGITVAVGVLGVVLLLMMYSQAARAGRDFKATGRRSRRPGHADLLNYAAVVDDGVVIGKNGAFMASWIFASQDNMSSTAAERNVMSARINQALAGLGNGWMVHIDAVRREAARYPERSASRFPDPITLAIDEERRELFEARGVMYEGFFVITATYFPPMLATQKFTELMFVDDQVKPSNKVRTEKVLEDFKREAAAFESRLSTAFKLTRLRGVRVEVEEGRDVVHDEQVRWLQYCATGRNHPVVLPDNPLYLDTVISCQDVWTGTIGKVGNQFVQVVAIDGFPQESTPGILSDLSGLRCEYRWNTRFIFMDAVESVKELDKYRQKWRQRVRGFLDQILQTSNGKINLDAVSMVQDSDGAIAEVNSGAIAAGYYTSVVVIMGDEREAVEADARSIAKAITMRGFGARIETINTMDAYFGSLPGHGVENVRRPLINTLNLADLMPTNTVWTGEAKAPCPMYPAGSPALMECVTSGATPFRLNLHVRDVGHSLIFGPTGAGKSTLLGLIAAQLRRYDGMNVFAFDKGMSMFPLCAAVGGQHFVVGGDEDELAFCPLQFLETTADRAWAGEWIESILQMNSVAVTPRMRNEIAEALKVMGARGISSFSHFTTVVGERSIAEALKPYTVDGAMGRLLDAKQDGLSLSSFTVFEIEDLLNLGEKFALPVLLYLFRRIEKSLKGQPAVIILDEAWIMLANPVFREKIREWLKTLRKANCAVVMATQALADAVDSGILSVMVESTATKIYLPNPNARDEDQMALYRRMGLNTRQVEIIAGAQPKRHYYYVSEKGRRLFELALGGLALSFVGATDKDSIADIKKLMSRYGERWTDEWLANRGVRRPKVDVPEAA